MRIEWGIAAFGMYQFHTGLSIARSDWPLIAAALRDPEYCGWGVLGIVTCGLFMVSGAACMMACISILSTKDNEE